MANQRGIPVTLGTRSFKQANKIKNIPQAKLPVNIGRDGLVTQKDLRRDLHQDLRDA